MECLEWQHPATELPESSAVQHQEWEPKPQRFSASGGYLQQKLLFQLPLWRPAAPLSQWLFAVCSGLFVLVVTLLAVSALSNLADDVAA